MTPSSTLNEQQINSGLKSVTKDGLFTEAMVAFTGGTFLVAMALKMGASNFQIGLLASLPTLSNIFQLVSVWLVQRYNNRRAISVICNFCARFPLLIIGVLPFVLSARTSVTALIFLLFFHYSFGAIAGATWNSWMKDLVPEEKLGNYFSYRARLVQITNVVFSIMTALALDLIKSHYPQFEVIAYPIMFLLGGIMGMLSVYMLYRTPEPRSLIENGHIFRRLKKPLQDINFRKLLLFNSFWAFSLNLATPFFSVFLIKSVHVGLSTIIILNIISQLCSILFVRVWGNYSDRFSNKTVIRICAPLYIACIFAWTLVGNHAFTIPLLIIIHIVSGITTGGINLAITNIGLKLAAREDAIVYIAARNMLNAFVPALAPIIGGVMADFFAVHQISLNVPMGSHGTLLHLSHWSIFFVISSLLALISLRFLKNVKEEGEVARDFVMNQMVISLKVRFRNTELIRRRAYVPALLSLFYKDKNQKRA